MLYMGKDMGYIEKLPTREIDGIRYDFNMGLRLWFPTGVYGVEVYNNLTGDLYAQEVISAQSSADDIFSPEKAPAQRDDVQYSFPYKYYIPYRVRIHNRANNRITNITLSLENERVGFKMPQNTLGDPLYMLAGVFEFVEKHRCLPVIYCSKMIKEVVQPAYPHFEFRDVQDETPPDLYATYYTMFFFTYDRMWQPYDFRTYSMTQQSQHILGLPSWKTPAPPKVVGQGHKPLGENPGKCVAISYTGSKQCKFWNNPRGWYDVITWLHGEGYRVICIDKDPMCGLAPYINHMPWGVEDFTGALPLSHRVDILRQCEFFIGTPSGLAALAWCVGLPVVMISGFSLPLAEFENYRVINPVAECIGCWNDTRIGFAHHDYGWCPRITPIVDDAQRELTEARQAYASALPANKTASKNRVTEAKIALQKALNHMFVCTKKISANMVIEKAKEAISDIRKKSSRDSLTLPFKETY
jgi:autotransporter strand-loop-strand O-heptosyltransferase